MNFLSNLSGKVSPYMGGIGISSAVVSFNVALYYNTIIAWCLFYFVQVRERPFNRSYFVSLRLTQRNLNLFEEFPIAVTLGGVSQ